MPANMNLSFAGCGFLGIYHVGVAVCFKKYAPHLLLDKISGASAGAIAACALLCDLPIGEHVTDILKVVKEARTKALGPFSPSFNIHNLLLDSLKKILPEDAHRRVNGKLHISLTRVYDGKNVIVSQFTSKEDLLQALLASCFVPVFSGMLPPRFRGIRYMDGGFSDNLPVLDENTITVSPFCGESDICPRDASSQLFHVNVANTSIELSKQNIYRFTKILFPPKPEVLASMCKQGFDDALRFLHRNNLLNCTRCLSVNSTFTISDSLAESFEYDPHCEDCKNHRQEALMANLPDTVLTIFQDAIDSANKGLMNWVFRHRGMKILSYLSLPYTVPADIVYATFTNLIGSTVETRSYQMRVVGNMVALPDPHYCTLHRNERSRLAATAPEVKVNLRQASRFILNQLALLFQHMNKTTWQLSAKISCQLAINQCGSVEYHGDYDYDSSPDSLRSLRRNMNLNLSLNSEQDVDEYFVPKPLSRWSSTDLPLDNDTFEHILQVTTHHEAVMAFYYMDEQNKVKLTEVFDVTDADSSGMLSPEERENNMFLEFDDDFEDPLANTWTSQLTLSGNSHNGSSTNISEISFEEQEDDYPELEPANIFSDPESEWLSEVSHTSTLPEDKHLTMCYIPEQSLPESDQPVISMSKSNKRKQQPVFED